MGAFVEGLSPETAKKLLAIAAAKGISARAIKTTTNGYDVPSVVANEFNKKASAEETPAKKATPRKRTAKKAAKQAASAEPEAEAPETEAAPDTAPDAPAESTQE